MLLLAACVCVLGVRAAAADPGAFLEEPLHGWFWYEQPKEKKQEKEHFPPRSVKEAKKELQRLLEEALEDPRPEKVARYIRLQNWLNARAEAFAWAWKEALILHPELDYSLEHPVEAVALAVHRDEEERRKRAFVRELAKRYGLFFVFRSTCPFCHAEAPILRRFSARYGMAVLPISLDGRGLPGYPRPLPDYLSDKVRISAVPALFLADPRGRRIVPVAFGVVSERELVDRLAMLGRMLDRARGAREAR